MHTSSKIQYARGDERIQPCVYPQHQHVCVHHQSHCWTLGRSSCYSVPSPPSASALSSSLGPAQHVGAAGMAGPRARAQERITTRTRAERHASRSAFSWPSRRHMRMSAATRLTRRGPRARSAQMASAAAARFLHACTRHLVRRTEAAPRGTSPRVTARSPDKSSPLGRASMCIDTGFPATVRARPQAARAVGLPTLERGEAHSR